MTEANPYHLPWKAVHIPHADDGLGGLKSGWRIVNALGDVVCQGNHSMCDERDFKFIVEQVNAFIK